MKITDQNFDGVLFSDEDANIEIVKDLSVAIIGYGNQGSAQAQNLRDSEVNVIIGARKGGNSWKRAVKNGFKVYEIAEACEKCKMISILLPDEIISKVFDQKIKNNLDENDTILFSHGYNIHYQKIRPPTNINVVMVAPSAPGKMVRDKFVDGFGVPSLIAVHNDYNNAFNIALSYAKAIGSTRSAAFLSTFKEETETDIFGEQALLTGGIPKLMHESFNILVENGYSPITAWFVCYYEVKNIVDLLHSNGINQMYKSVSGTAEFGGRINGGFLIDAKFKSKLNLVLSNIKGGKFFKEWEFESNNGYKTLEVERNSSSFTLIDKVTKILLKFINRKKTIV